MIDLPTRELPEPDGIGAGETIIDTDEDGIPDAWEMQFGHNPSDASDAAKDFDLDGVTAMQEYQLYVSSNGSAGNPLGNYVAENVLPPSGNATTPSVTLVETAANGIILARVLGVLTGATVSSFHYFIYRPSEKTWTKVTPPSGVTATITCLDVNSLGQVAGYYSQSGYKGFIWTPSTSDPRAGSATPYVINPTSSTPLQAIPVKISNTGYSLYTNRPGGVRRPADHKCRTITPVSNPWTSVTYLDVNDYGEYIGTVYDPYSFKIKTFLVIPEGMLFVTAMGYDDLPVSASSVITPNVDLETLQWEYPSFTYPDDYYDEYGNSRDPYAHNGYFETAYATDSITGISYIFRKGYSYNSGNYYSTGNLIYFREDDGSTLASQGYLEWQGFNHDLYSLPAALNDWGEFSGKYSRVTGYAYDYSASEGLYTYGSEATVNGSFIYDGIYKVFQESTTINNINNQKQVLSTHNGSFRLYSDGIMVPLTRLASTTNFPRACRLSDNGVITTQLNTGLRILRPNNDVDGDVLPDDWERLYGLDPSVNDALTDSDGDGMNNYAEFYLGTNPTIAPVLDGNGEEVDMREGIDSDLDGIPNTWEHVNGMDYLDPADAEMDFDRDGFSNLKQYKLGTDHRGTRAFRIRAVGPEPEGVTCNFANPTLLNGSQLISPSSAFGQGETERLLFQASSNSTGSIPALWSHEKLQESGSLTLYKPFGSQRGYYKVAVASNGAYFATNYTNPPTYTFWSDPSSDPIAISGAVQGIDARQISNCKLSPNGRYLVATRTTSANASNLILWKLPQPGEAVTAPRIIQAPGITIPYYTHFDVNDYGVAVATITYAGVQRIIVVKDTPGAISTNLLTLPVGATQTSAVGISNHSSPIIAGSARLQNFDRAYIWNTQGESRAISSQDTTRCDIRFISPSGVIAGMEYMAENGRSLHRVFTSRGLPNGGYPTLDSYQLLPDTTSHPTSASINLRQLNDQGELLYELIINASLGQRQMQLHCLGKSQPIQEVLPPNSNYHLDQIVGITSLGSVVVTAWKDNVKYTLILNPDADTDGDGLPDAFEELYEYNPYLANASSEDTDGDGVTNAKEFQYGTNPREDDTDADGMKDGWEIEWGLLPLDPRDASLDPDQDRVSNLRESQIGTNPIGVYQAEVIHTVDSAAGNSTVKKVFDNGAILVSSLNAANSQEFYSDDSYYFSSTSHDNQYIYKNQETSLWETVQLRPDTSYYSVGEEGPEVYSDAYAMNDYYYDDYTDQLHSATYGYFNCYSLSTGEYFWYEEMLELFSDIQLADPTTSGGATSLGEVQDYLSTQAEPPELAVDEVISASAVCVSSNGMYRVHQTSYGRFIFLNEKGELTHATDESLWECNFINDQGVMHGLQMQYSSGTRTFALTTYDQHFGKTTVPLLLTPDVAAQFSAVQAYWGQITVGTRDGHLLLSIYGQQGAMSYVIRKNTNTISQCKQPGIGNESIVSMSSENGYVLGNGREPWFNTPDGSCVKIKRLRLLTGSTSATTILGDHVSNHFLPLHIDKNGTITAQTALPNDHYQYVRYKRANDVDNDDIPDDWEKEFADWLFTSGQVAVRLDDIDGSKDYTGSGGTAASDYEAINKMLAKPRVRKISLDVWTRTSQSNISGGFPAMAVRDMEKERENYEKNNSSDPENVNDSNQYLEKNETTFYLKNELNCGYNSVISDEISTTTLSEIMNLSGKIDFIPEEDVYPENVLNSAERKELLKNPLVVGETFESFNLVDVYTQTNGYSSYNYKYILKNTGKINDSTLVSTVEQAIANFDKSGIKSTINTYKNKPSKTYTSIYNYKAPNIRRNYEDAVNTNTPTFQEWINGENTYSEQLTDKVSAAEMERKAYDRVKSKHDSIEWPLAPSSSDGSDIAMVKGFKNSTQTNYINKALAQIQDCKIRVTTNSDAPCILYIKRMYFKGEEINPTRTETAAFPIKTGRVLNHKELADPGENYSHLQIQYSVKIINVNIDCDNNQDGIITSGIEDATSSARPRRFWTNYDQDVKEMEEDEEVTNLDISDSQIKTKRDLEDFDRLHLGIDQSLIKELGLNLTIAFECPDTTSPGIRIWKNADASGGKDYLTDELTASRQIAMWPLGSVYRNRELKIIPEFFSESGGINLIYESLSPGKAKLVVKVYNNSGDFIGITGSLHMHLMHTREMYQRAKIQNTAWDIPAATINDNPPPQTWSWDPNGYNYIEDPDAKPVTVIFVHGWNMSYDASNKYGEITYKRLWHQGFKGKFYSFRWPTFTGIHTYNASEYRAWLCGPALASWVNQLPNPTNRNLIAHSMGNVISGAALRYNMKVRRYALCNAAMSATSYDPRIHAPTLSATPDTDSNSYIREIYGLYNKFANPHITTNVEMINFGLPKDSALASWSINNSLQKADTLLGYQYLDSGGLFRPRGLTHGDIRNNRTVSSLSEAMGFVTQSRSRTAGAELATRGSISKHVDMNTEFNFGTEHSAQFQFNYLASQKFWSRIFDAFKLNLY